MRERIRSIGQLECRPRVPAVPRFADPPRAAGTVRAAVLTLCQAGIYARIAGFVAIMKLAVS